MDYPPIDYEILEETREVLNARFAVVIGYYLEDIPRYMQDIERGIAEQNSSRITAAAHTIKSASQQYGFMQIYAIARLMETDARREILHSMNGYFTHMRKAFDAVRPELAALIAREQSAEPAHYKEP